jgi:hypothetical protein
VSVERGRVLTAAYSINVPTQAAGGRFVMTGTVVRTGRILVVCRGGRSRLAADPLAVMQATLTAAYDRPGMQH